MIKTKKNMIILYMRKTMTILETPPNIMQHPKETPVLIKSITSNIHGI